MILKEDAKIQNIKVKELLILVRNKNKRLLSKIIVINFLMVETFLQAIVCV